MGHRQRLRGSLSALKRKGRDNDNEDIRKQIKLSGLTAPPTTRTEMVSLAQRMWESLRQNGKRSTYRSSAPQKFFQHKPKSQSIKQRRTTPAVVDTVTEAAVAAAASGLATAIPRKPTPSPMLLPTKAGTRTPMLPPVKPRTRTTLLQMRQTRGIFKMLARS
jgi:hypothetical protein